MRQRIPNEQIMCASLRCFAKFGYRKATLDDIAGELGILGSSMYAYAQNKRDLYEQTVRFVLLRWQERVKQAVGSRATPKEQLLTLCETALTYLADDTEFCALLRNDPSIFPMFPAVDPYEEINGESVAMIERILLAGQRSGDFRPVAARPTAELIFSLYKGFIIHAYVQGEEEYLARYADTAIDLVTNGLYSL